MCCQRISDRIAIGILVISHFVGGRVIVGFIDYRSNDQWIGPLFVIEVVHEIHCPVPSIGHIGGHLISTVEPEVFHQSLSGQNQLGLVFEQQFAALFDAAERELFVV